MLGKPVYGYGDKVKFLWDNGTLSEEKIGIIEIIDAYGTFFQKDEPSYDIKVVEENCLYKHVNESLVLSKCDCIEKGIKPNL